MIETGGRFLLHGQRSTIRKNRGSIVEARKARRREVLQVFAYRSETINPGLSPFNAASNQGTLFANCYQPMIISNFDTPFKIVYLMALSSLRSMVLYQLGDIFTNEEQT